MAVDLRVRVPGRVEAGQLLEKFPLAHGESARKALPVRDRVVRGAGVVVLASVESEHDVDEGRPQLAHGDVHLAAEMDGLQRLEEAISALAGRLGRREGHGGRPEADGGAEDLATALRRAGQAGPPGRGGACPPVEVID